MSFKRNNIIIYDLISEGEIELVDGLSSIYLNKTPIVNTGKQHLVINKVFSAVTSAGSPNIVFEDNGLYAVGAIRPFRIQRGYKDAGAATATAGSTTVTAAASFFDTAMIASQTLASGGLFQKLRIPGAGPGGTAYVGEIVERVSATIATVSPAIGTSVAAAPMYFDYFDWGTITSTGATLNSNVTISGTFYIDVGAPGVELGFPDSSALNYKFVKAAFRSGTAYQTPMINMPGFSNASFGRTIGTELKQYTDFHGQKLTWDNDTAEDYGASGGEIQINSNPVDLPVTCDRLLLTITTSALSSIKPTNQAKGDAGVTLLIFFDYKSGSGDWATEQVFGPPPHVLAEAKSYVWNGLQSPNPRYGDGDIYGRDQESGEHEFSFNIEQYKPFDAFRVRVRRVTPTNYTLGSFTYSNGTVVKSIQGFIEDKLSYPYSAYASVVLDSQEFEGSVPERSYHCYGIRSEVPTNYFTRREMSGNYTAGTFVSGRQYTIFSVGSTDFTAIGASSNTVGVVFTATGAGSGSGIATGSPIANYNRNVSTGADMGIYQPWDGNFRTTYTDNPVWILRSLLLENRFGLGNWLSADQINRYSFYSMARRCDELVPDGEGGLEPRFTCGVYLTQATEAYKIIKDFCTVMLAVPYWMDGQLVLEGDRPQEPVYTFTKANIIGGAFSYESTGSKTRPNQIAVTFNDRKNFYTQAMELVDDVEDMILKNRVYTEDAVAFGATSRSQAIRYAKWKLLTSKLNKELVSFSTGENAGFIKPGNIVRIQDADRYLIRNSGRVVSSTINSIVLDKAIDLEAGTIDAPRVYTLHVLVSGSATYLAQESATIAGFTYTRGNIIDGVITEEAANVLVDDAKNPVQVTWAPGIHLENRVVNTSPGSNITTLTVSSNFSAVPEPEFIWALTNTISNSTVEGSSRLYKVLGISEGSPSTYSISAVEHFNSKFDELDETYLSDDGDVIPFNDAIPSITNFIASLSQRNSGAATTNSVDTNIATDIIVRWTPPMAAAVNGTTAVYGNILEYTLNITGPMGLKIIKLPKTATQYVLENVIDGAYEFDILAKGIKGAVTSPLYTTIVVNSNRAGVPGSVNQLGVPRGGRFSISPILDGRTIKSPDNYTFTGASGAAKVVSGGT